jgi:hypothetical protein
MPNSIHLICRREEGRLLNISLIDRDRHHYRSIAWEIPEKDWTGLVGGWVYLHETKNKPSEFGGQIIRAESSGHPTAHGRPELAVIFRADAAARGQVWRGTDHSMAWWSGPIEPTSAHELP